jgi:hypothetical protein
MGDGVRGTCLIKCGTCEDGGGVMEDVVGGAGDVYFERSYCGIRIEVESIVLG